MSLPSSGQSGALRLHATALRTAVRLARDAFPEEQRRDLSVGCGGERRDPPGGAAALLAPDRLAPLLEELPLALDPCPLEQRAHHLEQLAGRRVRLGLRSPATAAFASPESSSQNSATVSSVPTSTSGCAPTLAQLPLDPLGDVPQMLLDEVLDVALEARLRPAALVVAPRQPRRTAPPPARAGRPAARARAPARGRRTPTSAPSCRPTSGASGATLSSSPTDASSSTRLRQLDDAPQPVRPVGEERERARAVALELAARRIPRSALMSSPSPTRPSCESISCACSRASAEERADPRVELGRGRRRTTDRGRGTG